MIRMNAWAVVSSTGVTHLCLRGRQKTMLKLKERDQTIALAGVDPGPVIVKGHEKDELEPLIIKAIKKSRAIDNDMLTRKYRKQMIRIYITESFKILGF